MQFDRNILRKLANPIYRSILTLLDSENNEIYRVVDTRQNVPDRILGVGPDEWAIMDGEELVARVALLPKQRKTSVDLLGKVRDFFASSNRGIVSVTGDHALAAPIALGTLLIINELTASRSGGSN